MAAKKTIYFWGMMLLAYFVFIDLASANTLNTGMPWEGPMDKVVKSITGPVAKSAGVVALTGTGLTWAFGIGNDMVQRGAKIGTALTIAFNATSHLLPALGFAKGFLL